MVATYADAASMIASRSPTVAIVEDDGIFREYLTVLFRSNNCRVVEATCGRDILDILATQKVDCVILDYNLMDENGLSVHAQIKDSILDTPPIVMLTQERNERTIIKAFRGGVSDYVLKEGLKTDELFRAVHDAMTRHEQVQIHDAEVVRLKSKSEFDHATGLYSREAINDRLAGVVANRSGRCGIVLVTVDNLDSIGEKFGQVITDRAVRAFVTKFKKSLGPYDIGGRYDALRFISITDVDVRFKTIDLTCAKLAQALSFDVNFDAVGLKLSAAIGAAIFPANGRTIAEVLAAAEQALRNAQARGMPYVIAEGGTGIEKAAPAAASMGVGEAPRPPGEIGAAQQPRPLVERKGDRRSVPRQRVFKRGQIALPNLCSMVECTVRDISSKGARVRLEGPFVAPDQFDLILLPAGARHRVLRRWQKGNELGVEFCD